MSCGKFLSSDSSSVTHSFPGSVGCGRNTFPDSISGVTALARASFEFPGDTGFIPEISSLRVSRIAAPFALSSMTRSCTISPYGDTKWSSFLRSEEHTSELQSRFDLVCRLLLENKQD